MHEASQNLTDLSSPDFSKIKERPRKSKFKKNLFLALKILAVILFICIIGGSALGIIYYNNVKQAYNLSFSAKADLESSLHQIINRDFKGAAVTIKEANTKFSQAKDLLDQVVIVRRIPYIGLQLKAVDQVLIAGLKLTASGEKVVLLINDITAPLHNESINYASITAAQKKEILRKIVDSESLLYEVQKDIDEADAAIQSIPAEKLVAPLRDGIAPLRENLPKVKILIDNSLPLLRVVPKIAGFEQPRSYLFLLQNNSELRPTGGFIGTYGILKVQDGEIKEFDTDNVYNLDRSTQNVVQEPSPWPIAKYLEQKYLALRDCNWAPDFPTTAQKALDLYQKENQVIIEMKRRGEAIIGEKGTEITDVIPYEENLNGVIAMTPEILGGLLKLTGPIVTSDMVFTDTNYQEQLELMVGKLYEELDIPISERKGIIKKLADQIKVKLMTLPLSRMPEILDIGFQALDQKQILIYTIDPEIQKLVIDRGWTGEVKQTEGDYLFVVDSNLAALKTDQFVTRYINYSLAWQNNDLVAKVAITYQNDADFTWKSSRLRTYTRIYVPLGSELISSQGAMDNDKVRDPSRKIGEVEVAEEFGKTYFGAFIPIEPHEKGTLSFEYKLPERIKNQIALSNYSLIIQKQPGVFHNLTLDLKFGKNIKSATPPEPESEWFNTAYNNKLLLDKDKYFNVNF